jgi:hypothetical protein
MWAISALSRRPQTQKPAIDQQLLDHLVQAEDDLHRQLDGRQ